MISVIGAGVAGSHSAFLLARAGFDVRVFEEHGLVGRPFACTGIVTRHINDVLKVPGRLVLNRISRYRIYSPSKDFIEIRLDRPDLVLDRIGLDNHLKELAEGAGARFYLNRKFMGLKEHPLRIRINQKEYETDKLIGADGPRSSVARAAGILGRRAFVAGVQATVRLKMDNSIDTYLFSKGFGWSVPISEGIARIGVISSENPGTRFRWLLEKAVGRNYESKILERQSGIEPIYAPEIKTQKNNIYLVGDAATQVKAATFGGIIQALLASRTLCECIAGNKDYDNAWKRKFGSDLLLSLIIRRALNSFSDNDYNSLIRMFKKDSLQAILRSRSRDFPTMFLLRLLIAEPRLLSYIRFLPAMFRSENA